MTSVDNTHPGASQIVGGVEEVVGLSYPMISDLTRQYATPLGQRLFLFVKASPTCVLQGGVETLLKLQKSKGNNNRSAHTSGANTPTRGYDNDPNTGDPFAAYNAYGTSSTGSTEHETTTDAAAAASFSSSSKKTPNIGGFFKKAAKKATGAAKQATGALGNLLSLDVLAFALPFQPKMQIIMNSLLLLFFHWKRTRNARTCH